MKLKKKKVRANYAKAFQDRATRPVCAGQGRATDALDLEQVCVDTVVSSETQLPS